MTIKPKTFDTLTPVDAILNKTEAFDQFDHGLNLYHFNFNLEKEIKNQHAKRFQENIWKSLVECRANASKEGQMAEIQ